MPAMNVSPEDARRIATFRKPAAENSPLPINIFF
jgi:hypothetical protein